MNNTHEPQVLVLFRCLKGYGGSGPVQLSVRVRERVYETEEVPAPYLVDMAVEAGLEQEVVGEVHFAEGVGAFLLGIEHVNRPRAVNVLLDGAVVAQLEVCCTILDCAQPSVREHLARLLRWADAQTARVAYDSEEHGLTPAAFNARTLGVGNLLVAVETTTGDVFGGFTSFPVPCAPLPGRVFSFEEDPQHFAFVLRTPVSDRAVRLLPRRSEAESLMVYSDTEFLFVLSYRHFLIVGINGKRCVVQPDTLDWYVPDDPAFSI